MNANHPFRRARLLAAARHVPARLRAAAFASAATAMVFAMLAMPASAGTTQVSSVGIFNDGCVAPVGAVPADTGDYPPIDLAGSLDGCWYTYVTVSRSTPSGAYYEEGNELFVGCLNAAACGSFTTDYKFTGKYDENGAEIHGRCEHAIVGGEGGFAGAKGVLLFKDDVVNLTFDVRGQIMLASPGVRSAAKSGSSGSTRIGGC